MPADRRPLLVALGAAVRDLRVSRHLSQEDVADLAGQRTKVAVTGWDVAGKSAIRHQADDAAISSEVGSDVSGVGILAQIGEQNVVASDPHIGASLDAGLQRGRALLKELQATRP